MAERFEEGIEPESKARLKISWSRLIWGTPGTNTMNLLAGFGDPPFLQVCSISGSPVQSDGRVCCELMLCQRNANG